MGVDDLELLKMAECFQKVLNDAEVEEQAQEGSIEEDSSNQKEFDFVERPSEDFFCPVTFELLLNPQQTACCGNHLSEKVVHRLQRDGKPCPMCKESQLTTLQDKFHRRKVNAIRVRCPHKVEGCEWVGEVSGLQKHVDSCPKRPWKCQYCGFASTYGVHVSHNKICSHYPTFCPNKCEVGTVPRCDVQEHCKTCPLQLVSCEFTDIGCKVKVSRQDLVKHMKESQQQHLLSAVVLNIKLTKEALAEKDRQLAEKDQQLAEKDRQITKKDCQITEMLAESYRQRFEKDRQVVEKFAEKDHLLTKKDCQLAEKDHQLTQKDRQLYEMLAKKDRQLNEMLAKKDHQPTEKDSQLAEKDRQLIEMLAKKDRQFTEKDRQIAEKDRLLAKKDHLLSEKDNQHAKQTRQFIEMLAEKDRHLADKDRQVAKKHNQLADKDNQLAKIDRLFIAKLAEKDQQLTEKDHKLTEMLAKKDHQLAEKDCQLAEKNRQLTKIIVERDRQLAEIGHQLTEVHTKKDHQLTEKGRQLTEKDHQLAENEKIIKRKDEMIASREKQVQELQKQIKLLQTSVDHVKVGVDRLLGGMEHCHLFTVDKVSQDKEWLSDPFYSHCNGYKLRLSVKYYNRQRTTRTYASTMTFKLGCSDISVGLVLCKGEFDLQLNWPITFYIDLQLQNKVDAQKHIQQSYEYFFLKRCEDQEIDHNELMYFAKTALYPEGESSPYIANDSMELRLWIRS